MTLHHNEQIRESYSWKHIIVLLLICSRARERGDITGNDKGARGGMYGKEKERGWIEARGSEKEGGEELHHKRLSNHSIKVALGRHVFY